MPANPDELDWVVLVEFVELFDEIQVFNLAGGLAPAMGLPIGSPFGQNVDPKFGIRVDLAAFISGIFNGGNHGGSLHTNIGGILVAA